MTEGFSQTLRDLPRAWQELGRTRQLVIGGVGAAILVAIVAAVLFFQRPQQVALYANLNDQDAAAIVAKLKELKVPYTVTDGGGTINVPQAQAGDLRLQLAGAGLPNGTGSLPGMSDLFDKGNIMGQTDFAQRLNYQRGLEGELTKTISRLSPIESARVHLVLPPERLFTSQQKDTTASVVVKLKPAMRLTDEQVGNIRFLVSKSVEGLKPENVAVVDVNGNSLGKLDNAQGARNEEAADRASLQRRREQDLENKIQSMLTSVLGANRAVVRASVNLNWDEEKRVLENVTGSTTISSQDTRESFTGQSGQVPVAGGVPGTPSNIPNYQAVAGGTGDSTYTRSQITDNKLPSKEVVNTTKSVGEIRNIGIAVMVDQAVPAAQVDQITQLVTAAAGLSSQRGDQVSVATLPFDNSLSQELRKQQEEQTIMDYIALGLRVGGILIGLGGLFLLFRMMSNAVRPRVPVAPAPETISLPGGSAGLLPPVRVQEQLTEALEAARALPSREAVRAELETTVREELRAELETSIRGQVMAEVDAEVEARRREEEARLEALRQEEEAKRLEEEARRREEEVARAAELAKNEAARREQMRQSVAALASSKPEALAEILGQWIEQSKAAANVPAPRRATSALN